MGGLAAGGGRVQRAAGQGEHCEHLGGSLPRGIGRAVPHGACGYSITSGVPIKDILLQLFPATLELSLAALAALRQEMASPRHFWFAVAYQTALAWLTAFGVYQVGTLLLRL